MVPNGLQDVLDRAGALDAEDQLRVIAHLAEQIRRSRAPETPRRRWREIAGAAPGPLLGEDAQAWVTRTRREGDEGRERAVGGRP